MITVNGAPAELPDGATVAQVVARLVGGHKGRGVAVAVNGEVVPRRSWESTAVDAGDRVEVLTATQGG
jgi:sulfur carrier protein